MKLAGLRLRQLDSTTCGPSVGANQAWFDDEQPRVHAEVNRIWPRMLGTTQMGIARALTTCTEVRGVRSVIRKYRVAWASILIAWGLCGLLEAYLSYEAKVAPWELGDPPAAAWKAADSVLIVQNLILLTVAVFMVLESRLGKYASAPDVTLGRSRPR